MLISQKGLLLNDEFILHIDGINSLKHTESFFGGRVLVTVVPLGSLNDGYNLRLFHTDAALRCRNRRRIKLPNQLTELGSFVRCGIRIFGTENI